MRVVIACCGLEHTRRGFEAYSRELFDALTGTVDVVLCKGSGKRRPNEVVIPCLRRDFLSHFMNPWRAFYWEQITFAISLVPYLMFKKVDIVHFSEGNIGNALARFVRWTGLRTRLLQSNGGPLHPAHFRPEVFVVQVCKDGLDQALAYGIPAERQRLIPYGIAPESIRTKQTREASRRQFNLPADKFVVLALSALSCTHKRLDHMIQEVAAMQDEAVFLCMAGHPTTETPRLQALASELLPHRHKFLSVPRADVPELLAAADLFAHAAIGEGFGMVLLEACAAGVPVVCHDSPHFRWVLDESAVYVDMRAPGELAARIQALMGDRNAMRRYGALGAERVETHYSWKVLLPRYLDMFNAIVSK